MRVPLVSAEYVCYLWPFPLKTMMFNTIAKLICLLPSKGHNCCTCMMPNRFRTSICYSSFLFFSKAVTCFILIWMYLINICSGSDLSDMQCMFQKDETHLWVAGHQGLMVDVDLRKGVISKTVMSWNRLLFISLLNMPFCTKCHHDKNFLSILWIFLNLFDWKNSVTSMLFLTYWRQYSFFFY